MSTYLYLQCLNHDPILRSDDEVGQHLSDLPRIRAEIANRDAIIAVADTGLGPEYGIHYTNSASRFLRQHPHCVIGIVDEYSRTYPITEEAETPQDTTQSEWLLRDEIAALAHSWSEISSIAIPPKATLYAEHAHQLRQAVARFHERLAGTTQSKDNNA